MPSKRLELADLIACALPSHAGVRRGESPFCFFRLPVGFLSSVTCQRAEVFHFWLLVVFSLCSQGRERLALSKLCSLMPAR